MKTENCIVKRKGSFEVRWAGGYEFELWFKGRLAETFRHERRDGRRLKLFDVNHIMERKLTGMREELS